MQCVSFVHSKYNLFLIVTEIRNGSKIYISKWKPNNKEQSQKEFNSVITTREMRHLVSPLSESTSDVGVCPGRLKFPNVLV